MRSPLVQTPRKLTNELIDAADGGGTANGQYVKADLVSTDRCDRELVLPDGVVDGGRNGAI